MPITISELKTLLEAIPKGTTNITDATMAVSDTDDTHIHFKGISDKVGLHLALETDSGVTQWFTLREGKIEGAQCIHLDIGIGDKSAPLLSFVKDGRVLRHNNHENMPNAIS